MDEDDSAVRENAWERMARQAQERAARHEAIIDRFQKAPSPETFRGLVEIYEEHRRLALTALQQCNNLKQMVVDLSRTIDTLQEKILAAEATGDLSIVEKLKKEHASYSKSLSMTETQSKMADETSVWVRLAIQREEKRLRQQAKRVFGEDFEWQPTGDKTPSNQ